MRIQPRATAGVVALLTLTLTGCATAAPPDTGSDHAAATPHVHAIVPAPDGGGFLLGTHSGLYAASPRGQIGQRVGRNDFDAMGLTTIGQDLIASGHPGPDTPAELGDGNLGIVRSTDGGESWAPVAFTGEKDFHALTAAPDGTLYGQATDSTELLASTDLGVTWNSTGGTLSAFGLAVDAAGRLLAITPEGVQVSTDQGATFTGLPEAPNLYLISASPDHAQLVGVDEDAVIWTYTAGATGWEKAGTVHGSAQAVTITNGGDVLVVDDSGLSLLAAS